MVKDTRTRMIDATATLIQARGYRGTSLSDVLAASGAPRGSLYFHFPGGKEDLVLEAVRAGVEIATEELRVALDTAEHPADGVRAFFRAAAREMVASDFRFGCPVAPVVLDEPELDTELDALCRDAFAEWAEAYRNAMRKRGVDAQRARRTARTVLAALEGALLLARSERDTAPLDEIGEEMADLVARTCADHDAATARPSDRSDGPAEA